MRKQIEYLNSDSLSVYNFNELTLQNLLNKFFDSIETCKENTDKTLQFWEWIKTQGLKEEVIKQVEELYNNGKLTELINKLANNIDNTIKVFKNEVNSQLEQIENNNQNKGFLFDIKLNSVIDTYNLVPTDYYSLYDGLISKYPTMFGKHELGKDQSGQYPIYLYQYKPTNYKNTILLLVVYTVMKIIHLILCTYL